MISIDDSGMITIIGSCPFYDQGLLDKGTNLIKLKGISDGSIGTDELSALVSISMPSNEWGHTSYGTYLTIAELAEIRDYVQEIIGKMLWIRNLSNHQKEGVA